MSFGNVIIADDHPVFLKGLKVCLEEAGIEVLAAVDNGRAALAKIVSLKPNLAILDISMPDLNGLHVAKQVLEIHEDVLIVFLSMYRRPGFIARAKELQVGGYLLKDKPMPQIMYAIKHVLSGGTFFDEDLEDAYYHAISPLLGNLNRLTATEKKVLQSFSAGNRIEEIAADFMISPRTVEKHRENINRKLDLGFSEKGELRYWAIEHRFLLEII